MTFKRHLVAALLVIILGCLIGVGWLIYSNQRAEMESERGERHTREVILQLGDLLSSLKDAETGQRGFIITGKPDFLEPYQASLAGIAVGLAELRRLTADNPRQQQRLDAITPLVAAKLANLKETIALRETQGFPAASAVVTTQSGKKIMDEIRALVAQAQAQEAQLLKERVAIHATDNRRTMQSVTLGSALGGLALLLLLICLRWELASRRRAETALRASEQRLRVATDVAELGIWTWQPDGDHISWENDRPYDIFCMPRTDAPLTAARFAAEFVHPEDLAAFERAIADTVQNGARLFYQGRVHCPDGELRWIELTGQTVAATGGPPLRVIGTVQDITGRKQAEQLLRESEQRFRALVLASSDLMFRMSPDWSEMRQVYDKNFVVETELPNGNWLEHYVCRDDQPRLMAAVKEAIRSKRLFEMEHRVRRADGSWGWMLSRAIPLLGARGEIVEWFGAGSDVTEQKRAVQALRESERFLRSSLDALPGHIAVLDESGTILEINEAWQRFGIENQATASGIGVGVNYLQHCEQSLSQDDQTPAYVRGIKDVIAGRQTRFEMEYPCHSPTEQRWFVMRVTRFRNPGPVRIVIEHDNCTGRKLAEDALRESEERFRALFDRGPIAIYSCDAAGIAQEFNPCAVRLWGREPKRGDSKERFSGAHKLYLPDGTFVPREQSPMAAVLSGDSAGVYDQEFIIERPDGSRISIIANTVPLKNEQGQITGAMCCFYDVTERNRLERKSQEQAQALTDLDRRKDEFLAMLSHELRNPLAALSNAVQLLRLQKNEAPLQQQARHIIERQLGQLKHLVDDLLEVSRITTGRVQLRQEQIALSGVVERAVETAQPLIARRRHRLKVSLPLEPVFLLGDAARLEQVLVNLLTNAAKYTDEGGDIWLSVEAADAAEAVANGAAAVPMVVIRVRDTGIGIAPELLPHIFDLFTQADHSLDRSQGGLGIGLCLVQRLVEMHGGSVEAHSVLGQGSEFIVHLPLLRTPLPASPTFPSPAPDTVRTTTKGCRVLVVDDNVDAAQSLARLLEMTGHEVSLAYDGLSAVQAVMDCQPDVVLLDIGLPGLDGFEVAQQIRQQAALNKIVLVALTGYGQDADRRLSQDAGFDYHLVKPARFSEIEKILLGVSERVT